LPAEGYEVVVVDNASSDETVEIAEAWPGPKQMIRLDENRGFGAANNIGIRRAVYDVVVLLNPDTTLVDGSLSVLATLARAERALCGPELLNEDLSRQPSASAAPAGWQLAATALMPSALMPSRIRIACEPWRATLKTEVAWLTGACIAAPRDVLLELGPFDERLHLYGEDMDLGLRAGRAGTRSLFVPEVARVVHLCDRSSGKRFSDAGLELTIANRRRVVSWRYGRTRAAYDFVTQFVYQALRLAAKRMMRRDTTRESRWLQTAIRLSRPSRAH
jgi:GT2 family glycosyltransferase